MQDWRRYLSDGDLATIERGKWARPVGYGVRPAVIVIDVQNYMAGEEAGNDPDKYPYAAPAVAWPAVRQIEAILAAARGAGAPIIYTRFAIDREAGDAGLFDAKIGAPESEYVYLEGTHGSEIVKDIAPQPGDLVITKKKPSSFFGTPLLPYLIERRVDTLIVTGGSTCNCVRATVFDAFSYNFRAIVPSDAVFDRMPISQAINLFDMNRCSADVVETSAVLEYLAGLKA
ncbi:MAG: isochorismatase family protein [Alphaproteobacteria bacterium]|jgi:nicotinamidase-related amidase|nr:isochorismatase family protein [Alphaproteobacteria bacterium]MDP6591159.1 isochorismatase family protein [Alphaproteobacteria bacterium]|tara:strand:+ start:2059 stop:2748 length:690 start_codon:yes stop_codon:yes gene_type:complete